jgi:Domain of unknown function (DUF222)
VWWPVASCQDAREGGFVASCDRPCAARKAAEGGRGVRSRADRLSAGECDRVSHRVDPRPRGAAKADTELATAAVDWGQLSIAKTEAAIDYWVDRYDPDALRRVELSARGRHVDIVAESNGSGVSYVDGKLC